MRRSHLLAVTAPTFLMGMLLLWAGGFGASARAAGPAPAPEPTRPDATPGRGRDASPERTPTKKRGHVRIATLGPRPLAVDAKTDPQKIVEREIAHWRSEFSQVLPDQPDLIVVPEACDRPAGLSLEQRLAVCAAAWPGEASYERQAQEILRACGITGGLIVHIGSGDGKLTAALRRSDAFLVHGLVAEAAEAAPARDYIRSLGLHGPVSIEVLRGGRLPYIDNLVNLVVSEDLGGVSMEEVMRVLCPNGVAYLRKGQQWQKVVKPRPETSDDWTHFLHDPSNNAVSHDKMVGPPRRMQWIGSPKYGRHHDRMSSVSAVVSAGGRVFYIIDEATRASILTAPQWMLVARDAFNGTVLWKQRMGAWQTHLWPLKSGPAQLPRRLVAVGDRVYVTLGLNAPLTVLDAATGATIRTCDGTRATEEILCSDGTLFLLVNERMKDPTLVNPVDFKHGYAAAFWDEQDRQIVALDAATGGTRWRQAATVLPGTLAADANGVYFHDGTRAVCLDRSTGRMQWQSKPVDRAKVIRGFYTPTLVVSGGVVLFSGGETAGAQTGSWYMDGKDTMTALSAKTGEVLWSAYHPPSGYRSAEDLLVVNGLVWTGETTSGRASGVFTGRDPYTGEVKSEFPPDVETYWFHHRCYRGKATDNYLLVSRTGTEFVDVRKKSWTINDWARGTCLYGVMPANGLVYNPPNPCACYLESRMDGFNALAPASSKSFEELPSEARLEKGPAYGRPIEAMPGNGDWPTYRHDNGRSGRTATSVATTLSEAWRTAIGGELTSLTLAEGKVFLADKTTHTVHARDADSGKRLWEFTAGGSSQGYVLYLKQGRPYFAVRRGGTLKMAQAGTSVAGRWVHLAGVLTADRLSLYVDGSLAGSTDGPGLLTADPAEAMQIGADEGSIVGDYAGPMALQGLIDEVRIHHRALDADEIGRHASQEPQTFGTAGLVLWYSFDRGDASDGSGRGNAGKVGGVTTIQGRFGGAMRFTGRVGAASDFMVEHYWTRDLPLLARAMVLAGDTLFVAGPPDLVDEEQAFGGIGDAHVQQALAEQVVAFDGRQGGLLVAVSTAGAPGAQLKLDALPVFDGMIATEGRLYLATTKGDLICLRNRQQTGPSR
jgi:outer membrane protein assembly factor BamB